MASIARDMSTPTTSRSWSAMSAAIRPGPHPTSATRQIACLLIGSMKAMSSDRSVGHSVAGLEEVPTNWTYVVAAESYTSRAVATWSRLRHVSRLGDRPVVHGDWPVSCPGWPVGRRMSRRPIHLFKDTRRSRRPAHSSASRPSSPRKEHCQTRTRRRLPQPASTPCHPVQRRSRPSAC